MDDACTIDVDPEGATDNSLEQATGRLIPLAGDRTALYSGPCKVKSEGLISGTHGTAEGGGTINPRIYTGSIPIDVDGVPTPEIPVGAVLTVTSSRRDQQLVGKQFRVTESRLGTFSVQRKLVLEYRE